MKRFFDHVIIGSMIEVLSLGFLWGQTYLYKWLSSEPW